MNLDSTACSQELPTIATRSQSSPNTNQLIRQVDYLGLPTSAWGGGGRLAPQLTVDLVYMSSRTSGPTCQPTPWFCRIQHPPPPSQRWGLTLKATWGTGEALQLTLNIITYPTVSTDSYEYPLCARHLPEHQDKY